MAATPDDGRIIALLRKRLSDLELAVMDWQAVMAKTGEERAVAYERVIDALTTDFRTAVLTSADMTEEQRRYWLEKSVEAPDGPPG